jgi:hypothetical protein
MSKRIKFTLTTNDGLVTRSALIDSLQSALHVLRTTDNWQAFAINDRQDVIGMWEAATIRGKEDSSV